MTQPLLPDDESSDEFKFPPNDATWQAYIAKLTGWGKRAMRRVKETTGNVDDVVASAMRSHMRQQQEGLMPAPADTDELWAQLVKHLNRKIDKYRKAQRAHKYSALRPSDLSIEEEAAFWELGCFAKEPSPQHLEAFLMEAMQVVEAAVSNPELREVAKLTLMSYTAAEIGEQLGLSESQIGRRRAEIRVQIKEYLDRTQPDE